MLAIRSARLFDGVAEQLRARPLVLWRVTQWAFTGGRRRARSSHPDSIAAPGDA